MEWDTAAAHAILNATNRGVYELDLKAELVYNKRDLKNPSFIVFWAFKYQGRLHKRGVVIIVLILTGLSKEFLI